MSVVVEIDGREAIPVRAIPLLTDWNFFSPDVVAAVFAGTGGDRAFVFGDLLAHSLVDGQVQPISKRWWKSWSVRELQALSEQIMATQLTHEEGYGKWRRESLEVLPAAAFVWKDEFEVLHSKNWNDRYQVLNCSVPEDSATGQAAPVDEKLSTFIRRALAQLDNWRTLNYSPFMQPDLRGIVMEGFESEPTSQRRAAYINSNAAQDVKTRIHLEKQSRLAAAATPQGVSYGVGGRGRTISPVDYPLQPCDFTKWARYDSLPIERACFALFGFEPPPLDVLRFQQDSWDPRREPTYEVPPEYIDALESLRVSIQRGKVLALRIREYPYETQHVTWPELYGWAKAKGFTVPTDLEAILSKMEHPAGGTRKHQAENKVDLRGPSPPVEPETTTTVAGASDDAGLDVPVDVESADFGMLATRHQLIAAFGSFTGMSDSWFKNLRDRPKLLAARRVAGTGGRRYTEPLFCPYAVMQWLTTKPRNGDSRRYMTTPTGWRMLKANFAKVYSRYSFADPSNDSTG